MEQEMLVTPVSIIKLELGVALHVGMQKFVKERTGIDLVFNRIGLDLPAKYDVSVTVKNLEINQFRYLIFLIGWYAGKNSN